MMFFWISVVPASIVFPRERRNWCSQNPLSSARREPVSSSADGPRISRQLLHPPVQLAPEILPIDLSGPSLP
jgi:hypothetical protein